VSESISRPISRDRLVQVTGRIDAGEQPSPARVYSYALGGEHYYAVDRLFVEKQVAANPDYLHILRSNRGAVGRVVEYAHRAHGITQFIDIGSGLPTEGNVHEIADEVAPGRCSVVYVDNEQIAVAHSEILLSRSADRNRHHAVYANFLDVEQLWEQVMANGSIQPDRPICLMLMALVHFIPDEARPESALGCYREILPPGSLLAISHITFEEPPKPDEDDKVVLAKWRDTVQAYTTTTTAAHFRSREHIRGFLGDFEVVEEPEWTSHWRVPDVSVLPEEYRTKPWRSQVLVEVGKKP
jgi:S-adenosyl methyltransferase